jgi:predicted amidohydrolase YtcJ
MRKRKSLQIFVFGTMILSLLGCGVLTERNANNMVAAWTSTASIPSIVEPEILKVVFDPTDQAEGLWLDSGGDVDTIIVSVGTQEELAVQTGNNQVLPADDGNIEKDAYMQFRVDDAFIYRGLPTSKVQIEIEYFDQGTDSFNIHYDALNGGPYGDGRFKETNLVQKTDSGEFKTAVFLLDDAYFANRDNGADFRISDNSDGAETIRHVTVILILPTVETSLLPTETQLASTKAISELRATMIFYNGMILTMEAGIVTTALAIQGDRVLDLGNDENMLRLAGPDTILIDLEGRTIMPGFVDPHSHLFNSWEGDLMGAQEYAFAYGITTIAEMGPEEGVIQELMSLNVLDRLRLRISIYLLHVDNCGNLLGAWYLEDYPASREPGEKLQFPGIKIFNDGGSCNAPAVSFEYLDGSSYGDLYLTVEELSNIITEAQNYGYQVAIHSLGDRAIEVSQSAIARALEGGANIYRHRIEHNALLRDDLIPRYSEIGIIPLIFGAFPTCFFVDKGDRWAYATPEEYQVWEWRWRPLIDANPDVHVAWHADYPPLGTLDPIDHLYGFITRQQVRGDGSVCEPPDWAADDLLSVEEALSMMTIEPAYALFREDEVGSLKAGKFADLIILSDNPLLIDPDSILDIEVLMTMVGGKVEYCIQGMEVICPGYRIP